MKAFELIKNYHEGAANYRSAIGDHGRTPGMHLQAFLGSSSTELEKIDPDMFKAIGLNDEVIVNPNDIQKFFDDKKNVWIVVAVAAGVVVTIGTISALVAKHIQNKHDAKELEIKTKEIENCKTYILNLEDELADMYEKENHESHDDDEA